MQKRLSTKAIIIGLILCCAIGVAGTTVSWNGTSYTIPSTGETDWSGPTKVDGFLVSVASNALSKAGGNFTLTADVNFGASFGLLAPYFSARTNAASTGFLRMDNGGSVSWRNAANSADLPLSVNSSNELTFNGFTILNSSGLLPAASGGTGIGSYTAGDTLYASGATTLSKLAIGSSGLVMVSNTSAPLWQKITDAQVQDSAGISRAKLASGSADHVVINSAAGAVSSEATLAVSRGGTNTASYTTGDLLYASGATTLTKLGIGSTGQQLTVSGGVPAWGSASGTASVSGIKVSNYSIQSSDDIVIANSNGGSIMLTLPSAASNAGKTYGIRKVGFGTSCFGVAAGAGDYIEYNGGVKENDLCTEGESIYYASNGSSIWYVTDRRIPYVYRSYTPTCNSTTNTTPTGDWRRIGDSMLLTGKVSFSGTPDNVTFTMSLPTGYTIDTSKWAIGTASGSAGSCMARIGGNPYECSVSYNSTTTITFWAVTVSNAGSHAANAITRTTPDTVGNGDFISYQILVPITGWEG